MVSIALSRLYVLVGICFQGNQANKIEEGLTNTHRRWGPVNCQIYCLEVEHSSVRRTLTHGRCEAKKYGWCNETRTYHNCSANRDVNQDPGLLFNAFCLELMFRHNTFFHGLVAIHWRYVTDPRDVFNGANEGYRHALSPSPFSISYVLYKDVTNWIYACS